MSLNKVLNVRVNGLTLIQLSEMLDNAEMESSIRGLIDDGTLYSKHDPRIKGRGWRLTKGDIVRIAIDQLFEAVK